MSSLKKILNFVEFTNKFRRLERDLLLSQEKRCENDAEHSYQLAIVGWYIISSHKWKLDINKVLQYALVHDLVEVYAGDTPIYFTDKKQKENKHDREVRAAKQVKKEFTEFKELHSLIQSYESRKDEESKFVYVLDKILPMMVIYLGHGYYWKKKGVTLEMMLEQKVPKVVHYPGLKKYFDEFVKILQRDKNKYFNIIKH
ncbi:MAG: HD domain-containing protein [bacterium]|nr:HD domain-containing protein [bacterium]